MRVLLVGGAGYIGSHVAVALCEAGHDIAIVDDLSNSAHAALERIAELGRRPLPFLRADARDAAALGEFVAGEGPFDALVLLAGLKSVGDSVSDPITYYAVNIGIATTALQMARDYDIHTVVFSSSATVYGDPDHLPVDEEHPTTLDLPNPYGKTKRVIEELLRDAAHADPDLRIVSLRYFNPVGAHPSGRIGEDPTGQPTNLLPIVAQVAGRTRPHVTIFGGDYPTPDGTGLRDYIDVVDLAAGHVAAIARAAPGFEAVNLGTGHAVSVLELVRAFETAASVAIPTVIGDRRPGDVAVSYADPAKAAALWGWRAERTIEQSCAAAWHWQQCNPRGYPRG